MRGKGHSFATYLLLGGVDIRQRHKYLGHANVETTTIDTHVVKELRSPGRTPLDALHSHSRLLRTQSRMPRRGLRLNRVSSFVDS